MHTTSTSTTIGERIRSARKQAGLTRAELASAVGASVQAVGFWETGVNEPRTHHLQALCKALGIALIDRISIAAATLPHQSNEFRTPAAPARPASPVLHELLAAEAIIIVMLGVMTTDQKLAIAAKLDELGVSGEGATRFHERRAALIAAGAV